MPGVSSLFLSVLPLALGAAVSPTLLTLELLILAGRNHPLSRAWSFALGASGVLIAYAVVGLAFLQRLPDAEKAWVAAAVVAIALSMVLLPVLSVTLLGARAHAVLAAMNRFTTDHKRQINAAIAFFFAVWLLWSGGSDLRAVL